MRHWPGENKTARLSTNVDPPRPPIMRVGPIAEGITCLRQDMAEVVQRGRLVEFRLDQILAIITDQREEPEPPCDSDTDSSVEELSDRVQVPDPETPVFMFERSHVYHAPGCGSLKKPSSPLHKVSLQEAQRNAATNAASTSSPHSSKTTITHLLAKGG